MVTFAPEPANAKLAALNAALTATATAVERTSGVAAAVIVSGPATMTEVVGADDVEVKLPTKASVVFPTVFWATTTPGARLTEPSPPDVLSDPAPELQVIWD